MGSLSTTKLSLIYPAWFWTAKCIHQHMGICFFTDSIGTHLLWEAQSKPNQMFTLETPLWLWPKRTSALLYLSPSCVDIWDARHCTGCRSVRTPSWVMTSKVRVTTSSQSRNLPTFSHDCHCNFLQLVISMNYCVLDVTYSKYVLIQRHGTILVNHCNQPICHIISLSRVQLDHSRNTESWAVLLVTIIA